MTISVVLFYVFSALAILGALGLLLNFRNVVAGAICLVGTMVSLAALYVLLGAYFVAVVQIMVYAGAIVVVFLFVVMLLNVRTDVFSPGRQLLFKLFGVVVAGFVLFQFVSVIAGGFPEFPTTPEGYGGYRDVAGALCARGDVREGQQVIGDFVLPFEVASLLLLAAIVGSVVLAKRRLE